MRWKKFRGVFLFFWIAILLVLPVSTAQAAKTAATTKSAPKLSKTKIELALDKTCTLKMSNTAKRVKWKSSDPQVVSVERINDKAAELTGCGVGTATITAKITGSSQAYRCAVTVYDPVKMTAPVSSLTVGKESYVKISGTTEKVVWSCAQKKVLTITSKSARKVTFRTKASGKAYIKAKVGDRTYKYKITVKDKNRKLKIAVATSYSIDAYAAQGALRRLGATVNVVSSCNVEDYDGLVIPGGTDIDPANYGEPINGSVGINKSLDRLQLKMLDNFVKAGKPVFGICRGALLINVYFGGTLKQHINYHRGVAHVVVSEKGSIAYQLYGRTVRVLSYHHQAAAKIGEGLKVTQRASDKNVEALEHETLPVFCVQWHPEYMDKSGNLILNKFLQMCR